MIHTSLGHELRFESHGRMVGLRTFVETLIIVDLINCIVVRIIIIIKKIILIIIHIKNTFLDINV